MKNKEPKKWGIILITVFIAFSMILSIFAIVLDNQGSQIKYNNYKFTPTNEGYKVKIDNKWFTFQYYPGQLENIYVDDTIKNDLKNNMAYVILFNPLENSEYLQYIDFARFDFDSKIDTQVYFAITNESDKYLLPVLSCNNATAENPFLFFNIDDNTSITKNNNCIILNAKGTDIIALEERIVYIILGVMN